MTATRLAGFGTTIFTEMSALAERTGAINLGQGFPDYDGPPEVLEAAQAAMRTGKNQYAPLPGRAPLRHAVAEHQKRFYGIELDPATQVQVTMGATEAITAARARHLRARRRGARVRPHLRLLHAGRDDGRARRSRPSRCTRRTGASTPPSSPPRSRRARGC